MAKKLRYALIGCGGCGASKHMESYKLYPDDIEPAAVRKGLRRFLDETRGCVVEIILKDTHTCCQQPQRMWEWVRIARETVEQFG